MRRTIAHGALVAFVLAGCDVLRGQPTPIVVPTPAAPTVIVEPAPGYVRIVSEPTAPSFPVEIRFAPVGPGTPSPVYFEFAVNERILIVFPGTPTSSALQVNGIRCDGEWTFEPLVEIDVLLSFDERSCRTEIQGKHAYGEVHNEPGAEEHVDDP